MLCTQKMRSADYLNILNYQFSPHHWILFLPDVSRIFHIDIIKIYGAQGL